MKLFAWQPQGHGEYSLFVVAANEEDARKVVEAKIRDLIAESQREEWDGCYAAHHFDGWGTDYYELTIAEPGTVVLNGNDC